MNVATEPVQLKRKRKRSFTMEGGGSEGEEDESKDVGHSHSVGSEWCVAVALLSGFDGACQLPYSHLGLWNTQKEP